MILVVVDEPDRRSGTLNLLPRYFFLITAQTAEELPADQALAHYRQRGAFEDRLEEFQQAIQPHLSSPGFRENEIELLLALLSYNLLSFVRLEVEYALGSCWDLQRVQSEILKVDARVEKHSGRLIFHIAQAVRPILELLMGRLAKWRLPERLSNGRQPSAMSWTPPPRHAFHEVALRLYPARQSESRHLTAENRLWGSGGNSAPRASHSAPAARKLARARRKSKPRWGGE